MLKEIRTREELEAGLGEGDVVIVLKHGATCPISRAARGEVSSFCDGNPGTTVLAVEVTGRRELSDELARRFGVKHASPQLFLIRRGQVDYQASHFEISARELTRRLAPSVR